MSDTTARQPTRPPTADEVARPVVVRSHRYPEANQHGAHAHRKAQLVWAHDGVITVETTAGTWVAPPTWAVWVTSWLEHDVRAPSPCTMHGIYVEPDGRGLPTDPGLVAVSGLLREVILALLDLGDEYALDGPDGRLAHVLLDRLVGVERQPIDVPPLDDPLLAPIAHAPPSDDRTLAEWGTAIGASDRTLARRFRASTGLTFARWRTQNRMLAALEHLAAGTPVGVTARRVGYTSEAAFVAAFRRCLGTTPGRYFT